MSSRNRIQFLCTSCAATAPTWAGRCAACGSWNTLIEEVQPNMSNADCARLDAIDPNDAQPIPTGIDELDRVLSGGFTPGSVTLISGPPGVGKSTLSLQVAQSFAAQESDYAVLAVAAEETPAQVRRRSDRLGLNPKGGVLLSGETALEAIQAMINARRPAMVIIDSIQTIASSSLPSGPGTTAQVRHCAQTLADQTRKLGICLVLIGHITKDGSIAGPRLLEHLVDTVISFESDGTNELRLLRATKHRFGATGELGVFAMGASGLEGIENAGGFFLDDRIEGVSGSAITAVIEGRRAFVVEVQALVRSSPPPAAIRIAQGVDRKRADLVLASLTRWTGFNGEAFVSVAGGMTTREPAVDLAMALAMASSATRRPIDPQLIIFGELGLVGEVRRVPHLDQRLGQAARMGFCRAIIPERSVVTSPLANMELVRIRSLGDAIEAAVGSFDVKRLKLA